MPVPSTAESPTTDALLRDALDRGGSVELLRVLTQQNWDVLHDAPAAALAIMSDDEAIATMFPAHVTRSPANGAELAGIVWSDGMTIEFPEGVFDFPWPADGRCPRDLAVKGAGMDKTLLRFKPGPRGEIHGLRTDEVHGLVLLDLTVDCRSRGFLNARYATVRMERCRMANFNDVVRAQDSVALQARACRFEGAPVITAGHGLARFDDCVLWRGEVLFHHEGRIACLFLRCTFLHADQSIKARPEKNPGVRLEECVLDKRPVPNRKLWTINPSWRD